MNPAKLAGSGAFARQGNRWGTIRCKVSSSSSERWARRASAAMAAVTAALVGFFAFVILRVTAPQMSPLFTDLTPEDSAAIVKDLERQAIPYEIKNDGAIVMVPRDRMTRAAHEARRRRPAQGRRRRLRDLRQVRRARRHLASCRTSTTCARWKASSPAPSGRSTACRRRACISCCPSGRCSRATRSSRRPRSCCSVRGALEAQQVRAIRHLVASAVNGLKPQRVSIVDEAGRLLADGAAGDVTGGIGGRSTSARPASSSG